MNTTNENKSDVAVKTKWQIDPTHSEIQFKVKHLMITTVTGYFTNYSLDVETLEDDFTKASHIVFKAEIDSITTNNNQRDSHLKSSDFFDSANYREIQFTGTNYEKDGENYRLVGDLTIRDITKPVMLNVGFGGIVKDPYGQVKAGFTIEGKINRKDFGLSWHAVAETGNLVVSDEVRILCEVQLIKQM